MRIRTRFARWIVRHAFDHHDTAELDRIASARMARQALVELAAEESEPIRSTVQDTLSRW